MEDISFLSPPDSRISVRLSQEITGEKASVSCGGVASGSGCGLIYCSMVVGVASLQDVEGL